MAREIYFSVLLIILLMGVIFGDCDSNQIDINSASLKELDKIIWVGPSTAQKIVDARPFDVVKDLTKVSGIGEKKISAIIEQNLACVKDFDKGKNKGIEKENKKVLREVVKKSKIVGSEPIVESPVILTPKDIKSKKKEFNKGKLARAGLMTVSLILLCVFAFQFKKKWNQKKLKEV